MPGCVGIDYPAGLFRHADEDRHPRLSALETKAWMPTCVGMTINATALRRHDDQDDVIE